MMIKAIVVDLDRTLLRADKTISPYTAAVLQACRGKGIAVMIATARPLRDTVQFCEVVDFDAIAVSNGARILCGGRRIEQGIRPESAEKLLNKLACRPELRITLETGDCAYSNRPITEYETVICSDLAEKAKAEGALKILVHIDDEDSLPAVKEALTDDVYTTVANGYLIQIMSRAATKWNGIKAMLETCGCAAAETAYFGDDHDDIEPIKLCGIGVAVSNAIEEAKAAADHVAESNEADGVAKFIEQMLFEKRCALHILRNKEDI